MAKVDLILISGITAGDGSLVASGATLKFDSVFKAGSLFIRIEPRLYRNRSLFESGFTHIHIAEEVIPYDFEIEFAEEDFYILTPLALYQEVGLWLNAFMGDNYFELEIIE